MDEFIGHAEAIEACRQRSGRMLSIVDLIEAQTFSPMLAAYALVAIGGGASFMVGARPGGAGKTTVMGALLNFVPPDIPLVAADGMETIARGLEGGMKKSCFVCHEIGPGGYYAYLWGEPLRWYFELPRQGHLLATNLHADTLAEAQDQICRQNGIPEAHFRRMHLAFFLEWDRRSGRRRISAVEESDGYAPHRRLEIGPDGTLHLENSRWVRVDEWEAAAAVIGGLLRSGARTVAEVRRWLLMNGSSWMTSSEGRDKGKGGG